MEQRDQHLLPIAHAARIAGLSEKLFVSAVSNAQLGAVEILVLGDRGQRFVRGSSLFDFLEGRAAPDAAIELSCADLFLNN